MVLALAWHVSKWMLISGRSKESVQYIISIVLAYQLDPTSVATGGSKLTLVQKVVQHASSVNVNVTLKYWRLRRDISIVPVQKPWKVWV